MRLRSFFLIALLAGAAISAVPLAQGQKKTAAKPINIEPPHFSKDASVKIDYDIVYVRAPRADDKTHVIFGEAVNTGVRMEPGSDLMLLHPDGSEEVLVPGGKGAVVDPYVSFDGESVYFAKFHDVSDQKSAIGVSRHGADIFKIHVKTRKIVQLTRRRSCATAGSCSAASRPRDCATSVPGACGPFIRTAPTGGRWSAISSPRRCFILRRSFPTATWSSRSTTT
jgi:hypothetical protein